MSKKLSSLFVFLLVVSFIITACGSAVSTPPVQMPDFAQTMVGVDEPNRDFDGLWMGVPTNIEEGKGTYSLNGCPEWVEVLDESLPNLGARPLQKEAGEYTCTLVGANSSGPDEVTTLKFTVLSEQPSLERPFGCYEDEPYIWANENDSDVAVPYGETVLYKYEWSDLQWIAELTCDGSRYTSYGIKSDFPVTPVDGPFYEFACGDTSWSISGHTLVKQVCDESLIFGSEVSELPQASIIVEKDGRQMAIDLSFRIKDVETVNGPATYLSYHVWWGYLDTGDWAHYKCEGFNPTGFMAQGLGSQRIDDATQKDFAAVCGGEGMVLTMRTSR